MALEGLACVEEEELKSGSKLTKPLREGITDASWLLSGHSILSASLS